MLASDNHIFPSPTISKLLSIILTPQFFLVFLIFQPFSGRLARFGQYGYTLWSPQAGSRWSESTSLCDVAACMKSSGDAARRESSLCFLLFVHVTQRWVCLQTTRDGGDSDLQNVINCFARCCKRTCEWECLYSERKVLSLDFKEREDIENFEINGQVCL